MTKKKLQLKKLIIDVRVEKLDRAISFYRDVLGLTIITKADVWASFEAQGAEIHLYAQGGVDTGFEFRVADIEVAVDVLRGRDVNFYTDKKAPNLQKITDEVIMHFPWGKAVFFKDTEGNELALVEDI
ncbi:MAG: VOC family protein [Patescibacteria group bacterium]|nr:VOC family protein [Patescibacteria group bacterium]